MRLGPGTEYAGFWRRALATLVDLGLLAAALGAVNGLLVLARVTLPESGAEGFAEPRALLTQGAVFVVVVAFWVRLGGTPGKLLLGCRLVDARSGRALRVGQAALRNLAYLVSILPLGFGIWMMLWDPMRRGLHDRIAGSLVVIEDESRMELHELAEALE